MLWSVSKARMLKIIRILSSNYIGVDMFLAPVNDFL